MDGRLLCWRSVRINVIKDLGLWIDSSFSFSSHICSRASRNLGLVIWTTKQGLDYDAGILLFTMLVCLLLEYTSLVWSHQVGQIDQLHFRFVRSFGCHAGFNFFEVPVDNLHSLEERRNPSPDLSFLYKLIDNHIMNLP